MLNSFVSAVNYARSEAARRGQLVSIQANAAATVDNEWGSGFCVVLDNPGDCTTPLRQFVLEGTSTFNGIDGMNNILSISYNSRGLMQGTDTGAIQLCGADADDDPGRQLMINAIGRASVNQFTCYP